MRALYRELTGLGLAEAKQQIELLESSISPAPSAIAKPGHDQEYPAIGASMTSDPLSAVSEQLFRGNRIEAIKIYRESAKVGLKEAKERVDALEASLRNTAPEKFAVRSARSGCLGVLTFLSLCALAALYAYLGNP